jgi:hypothetical protein
MLCPPLCLPLPSIDQKTILKEFAKTHLFPGETAHIQMILSTSSFAFYDVGETLLG